MGCMAPSPSLSLGKKKHFAKKNTLRGLYLYYSHLIIASHYIALPFRRSSFLPSWFTKVHVKSAAIMVGTFHYVFYGTRSVSTSVLHK